MKKGMLKRYFDLNEAIKKLSKEKDKLNASIKQDMGDSKSLKQGPWEAIISERLDRRFDLKKAEDTLSPEELEALRPFINERTVKSLKVKQQIDISHSTDSLLKK